MSSCPGAGHCPGCKEGGAALAVVAVLVVAGILVWPKVVKAGHAVEHGTDVLRHTTYEVIVWASIVLACAVGLAITIGLMYAVTILARACLAKRERHAMARVPQTIVTSCTILPRSTPVPDEPESEPLAIDRGPSLLLALITALAAVGHEGAPTGSDDDETLGLEGAQAFARGRLRNPELLMNGDDARDHRTGR
jgi:hypothetical protein